MDHKMTAVILAAGKGSRMNSDVHKQFMLLDGKPLIYYALLQFQKSDRIKDIILVTGEDEISFCENEIVSKYQFTKVRKVIAGGKERYESVHAAMAEIKRENDTSEDPAIDCVIIHDGARPFVTEKMIEDSYQVVKEAKACTIGVPAKDTMKRVDDDLLSVETPDRRYIWNVQTPQTFDFDLLWDAYVKMIASGDTDITDDTMIMERYEGVRVKMIEGSYQNIKITTPEDMEIAKVFLHNRTK